METYLGQMIFHWLAVFRVVSISASTSPHSLRQKAAFADDHDHRTPAHVVVTSAADQRAPPYPLHSERPHRQNAAVVSRRPAESSS